MDTNEWSLPGTELFDRIRAALEAGEDAVLATVVDVEGSPYRRPGARTATRPDGGDRPVDREGSTLDRAEADAP